MQSVTQSPRLAGERVLVAGRWRPAAAQAMFHAVNPATGERLPRDYPISAWSDCDEALDAAAQAALALETVSRERIADFLMRFADRIDARKSELVEQAHLETALPTSPRLADVELPRTTNQLRQAAAAAREGSWALPTIDTRHNIRSAFAAIGPIVVFGPNNFPFAFSAVAGGDCAAALAAGNPVIAKAHPLHPGTSRLLAEEAFSAVAETGLPESSVQLLYHMDPQSGLRLVSDPRVGASTFTGSREAGLALKAAADAAGKPIYLEMSSINPVVMLPGALVERGETLAEDFAASCLLGGGQFCTNPGLVVLFAGDQAGRFVRRVRDTFDAATLPVLLSSSVARSLHARVGQWRAAGATVVTTDGPALDGARHRHTLLQVTGERFLEASEALQREAFGVAALIVIVRDADQAEQVLDRVDGNLTGAIYSDSRGADEPLYGRLAPRIRRRVGRLLNDKMPTGVAVSPAMCHGGPYPATGHPGFTAVGIPASLRRFAALQCYDSVRDARLPDALRDANPNGRMWRSIDGAWTQANIEERTT